MQTNLLKVILITALALPVESFAYFGTLGRDQCPHQQTELPTATSDYTHAANIQASEMEDNVRAYETRMNQVSTDLATVKKAMETYFKEDWSSNMMAHMDNSHDCCGPALAVSMNESGTRYPAANELVETYTPPPTEEYPNQTPVDQDTSCHGYPAYYCSNDWVPGQTSYDTSGKLCLQTGLASTRAWSYACRDGGTINPEVCSDRRVSKYPAEYQRCVRTLDYYRKLTYQQRTLAAQIEQMREEIYNIRNPNRPRQSETTNGNGFMQFMQILAPIGLLALSQYMGSKRSTSSSRFVMGPDSMRTAYRYTPGSRGYQNDPGRPPAYFGSNYGVAFSNNGVFGQILPGLLLGSLACATGTNGSGINLLSMLSGGPTLNLHASLGTRSNYDRYIDGHGNRYSGLPPHTFGDRSPPYQPGGIYGTTPNYPRRIPGINDRSPTLSLSDGSTPWAYNKKDKNYLGVNSNAYFYDQQLQQQDMLRSQQSAMDYELYRLRMANGGSNAINPNYSYIDLSTLLPQMLANPQQAGAQIYFNATSSGSL